MGGIVNDISFPYVQEKEYQAHALRKKSVPLRETVCSSETSIANDARLVVDPLCVGTTLCCGGAFDFSWDPPSLAVAGASPSLGEKHSSLRGLLPLLRSAGWICERRSPSCLSLIMMMTCNDDDDL